MIEVCSRCQHATLDGHVLRCGKSEGRPCLSLETCPIGVAVPMTPGTDRPARQTPATPIVVQHRGCGGCGGAKRTGEIRSVDAE